jgi:hypothetical protein
MKLVQSTFLLLSLSMGVCAQQVKGTLSENVESADFAGSDIPLVVIETNGGFPIPDEMKIKAHMKIIDAGPGEWNTPLDSGNVYDGNIGIEIRGAYSSSLPQKPYGFETRDSVGGNLNVPLLGMPEENDWILLANYNDKSFLRNSLAGYVFREMGHYAPRTRHCEVLVNGTYQGIYVLTEKIKRDKNRVDIATLDVIENSGDDVTGGYIFKTDYYSSGDSWISNFPPATRPDKNVHFVYSYPKPDEITDAQKEYIQYYVNSFETVLHGGGFKHSQTGYAAYIDVESFSDYFILSEVSRNVDAYKKSRFFFKDKESKGGRIHSGPPWDYDWAWKDIWDCYMFANTDGSGWAYEVNNCDVWPTPPVYMTRLLEDDYFANRIKQRYVELRKSSLSDASIFAYIDSVNHYLDGAQQRHYTTWDILGKNVGAPEVGYIPMNFLGETVKFKTWIQTRLAWLDSHMPGDEFGPIQSAGQATAIFRLFPNPASEMVYIESDIMIERIEIYTISGTRVYENRGGPGFSTAVDIHQFPSGIYLVRIATVTGENLVEKLVIQ